MNRPTIAIIMPTARDRTHLGSPRIRDRFRFHFIGRDIKTPATFDVRRFLKEAESEIKGIQPDGIVATDDYPAVIVASILARKFSLPGPSPQALFLCQHKYYSRLAQKKSVPKATPGFALVSLSGPKPPAKKPLKFPFFVKPVKAYLSILARRIQSMSEFKKGWLEAQERLPPFVRPFNELICEAGLDKKFTFDGRNLIAEEILSGHQVTLEGYVYRKKVSLVGVVDSIFYPGTLSFKRFEAPSRLPHAVQDQMFDLARRFIRSVGFDMGLFNIEFIYHPQTRMIRILEVNSRMASQFAGMMEALHGTPTYEILLDLAAGRRPAFRRYQGTSRCAASFVLRTFNDASVECVPSRKELAELAKEFPYAHVEVLVEPGRLLSDHFQQDDESYRYGLINLGAPNRRELFRRFEQIQRHLSFCFRPLAPLTRSDPSRRGAEVRLGHLNSGLI